MESRRVSQIVKAARIIMQISDKKSKNTKQSHFCGGVFFLQIGILEHKSEIKSDGIENKNLHYG